MAKRPLRAWMRDKLLNHAKEVIQPAAEKRALDKAYARAADLVTQVIEKKYPPRDMAVLAKYECVSHHGTFSLQSPDGLVRQFVYAGDGPRTPNKNTYHMIYLADGKTFAAVETWETTKDAFEAERRRRLSAFDTLVRSAAHVEDVIEVWPEAGQIIPAREVMAPIAPEQIAIIKADMRERKAA